MRLEIQKKHRFVVGNCVYNFGHDEFDVAVGQRGEDVLDVGLSREIWLKETNLE